MTEYISSLLSCDDGFLLGLREFAEAHRIPILRKDSASLLAALTALKKPSRILEAGTAIGYSSVLMAKACETARIETVEIDPEAVLQARGNIARAGLSGRIRVILGDATEVFASLSDSVRYDMIFLDSAKGQYLHMFGDVCRLLAPGGLLVADNCIFYGKVFDEPEKAPHKHRTIVANMRAFLENVLSGGSFRGTLLETGDGMLVAVKNGGKPEDHDE